MSNREHTSVRRPAFGSPIPAPCDCPTNPPPPRHSAVVPSRLATAQAREAALRTQWIETHADWRLAELEYSRLAVRVAPARFAARERADMFSTRLDALHEQIVAAECAVHLAESAARRAS